MCKRTARPTLWIYLTALLALLAHFPAAQTALSQTTDPAPLRIAAAADLQPLLPTLLEGFQKQTSRRVEASYASSATLATQIENGAPFDVFLSADMGLPEKLARDGFAARQAAANPVQPYARGTLVLWTSNRSGLSQLTLPLLATSAVHSIAIANPDHAPYGRAARQALASFSLVPAVDGKLRIAENIAQAAQFASTGNADVGLLSLTSALRLTSQGHYVVVPGGAYTPIIQGAVLLRQARHDADAAAFLRYLHTTAAGLQLRSGGLEPQP